MKETMNKTVIEDQFPNPIVPIYQKANEFNGSERSVQYFSYFPTYLPLIQV